MGRKVAIGFISLKSSLLDEGRHHPMIDYGDRIAVALDPVPTKDKVYLAEILAGTGIPVLWGSEEVPLKVRMGHIRPGYKLVDDGPVELHPRFEGALAFQVLEMVTNMAARRYETWRNAADRMINDTMHPEEADPDLVH